MIKTPSYLKFIEPLLYSINKSYISNYSECWIPDFAEDISLSGDLSHKYKLPRQSWFIGPLSRFYDSQVLFESEDKSHYDFLVMLSGPEPQRTILEEALISQLKTMDYKGVVLGGKPDQNEELELSDQIKFYSHLDTTSLKKLIQNSEVVISRPGYSTIMDLSAFGSKAIFIPTPGQTEQEYLAHNFFKKNLCVKMDQNKMDINQAMKEVKSCLPIKMEFNHDLLKSRVQNLLSNS
jgi:UDP:flavonoid glycosyltransferase YjiC (YdhE family)